VEYVDIEESLHDFKRLWKMLMKI